MKRLIYIDSLRGIASVGVAVFWHYKHFSNSFQPNSVGLEPPLYWLIPARFFFDYGDIMVDLFFVLSGVIFSYTYKTAVSTSQIGVYDFFIKRFSRLYPVHLFTLIVVAILVKIYHSYSGRFPVYDLNDTYHFILNIAFVQKGFFDNGYSFNAPAWSLSIEAFMYILFFIQARYWNVLYTSILLIIFGLFIYRLPYDMVFIINHPVARGLIGFFSGCLVYELLIKNSRYEVYRWFFITGYILCMVFYFIYLKRYIIVSSQLIMVFTAIFLIAECHFNKTIRRALDNKVFRLFGDISLSLYMIHLPVQIVILLFLNLNHITIIYNDGLFFAFYGLTAITFAWLLHITVEKPAQKWIRIKLKN